MNIEKLSTAELLAEIKKREQAEQSPFTKSKVKKIIEPAWVGKFAHEIPNQSTREKFAQYSTPPHIAEFMTELATRDLDLSNTIIYEPFVGAGAMFLPFKNKGAVLIGSDISLEALEVCKQLVPEAILIHHDSLSCSNPVEKIQRFQKRIAEIQELDKKNQRQLEKDKKEIERLEELIEKEKQRTPWRWDLYCVEHLIQEPRETFLNLTRILRDREVAKMRKKHNEGKEMYFKCFKCDKKELDLRICRDEKENIICAECYKISKNEP